MSADLEPSRSNNNLSKSLPRAQEEPRLPKRQTCSRIPTPPPLPPPTLLTSIATAAASAVEKRVPGQVDLNWPPNVKMSQQQAEARNLVLNEIKALQLKRQSSFKRILKLPIWGSGKLLLSMLMPASIGLRLELKATCQVQTRVKLR